MLRFETTIQIDLLNTRVSDCRISYMGGIYNKFQDDGIVIDKKRRVSVFALDFIWGFQLYF